MATFLTWRAPIKPNLINNHSVTYPGLSDHSIVTVTIDCDIQVTMVTTSTRVIKQYRRADIDKFLSRTKLDLQEMTEM